MCLASWHGKETYLFVEVVRLNIGPTSLVFNGLLSPYQSCRHVRPTISSIIWRCQEWMELYRHSPTYSRGFQAGNRLSPFPFFTISSLSLTLLKSLTFILGVTGASKIQKKCFCVWGMEWGWGLSQQTWCRIWPRGGGLRLADKEVYSQKHKKICNFWCWLAN
jgi:hypothetical protein